MLTPTRALLLACLTIMPAQAGAASKTATFVVHARIEVACTITNTIAGHSGAAAADTQSIAGSCTHAAPFRIEREATVGADAWRVDPAPGAATSAFMVTITF